MNSRRTFLRLLGGVSLTSFSHGETASRPLLFMEHACMGSRIKIYTEVPLGIETSNLKRKVISLLTSLESIFTVHRPDSEVLQLCRKANAAPESIIPVSSDLLNLTREAQGVSVETAGAFDLTMGSLSNYWRYCKATGHPPLRSRLESLKKRIGHKQLQVHENGISFHPQAGQVLLDFGGIAKGYAADLVMEKFKTHGVFKVCIDLGGEILTGDAPTGKDGWQVALTDHSGLLIGKELIITHSAVSTSGDRYQSIEREGVHYSHILTSTHPSGLPSTNQATIRAKTALRADALATVSRTLI